jgi:hypothetical protein
VSKKRSLNGPNTDARDQLSPDRHIRLAPHGRSIQKYMVKQCGPPSQGWRTFLGKHAPNIAAMDLFVVPTIGFDLLYVLVIVRLARRDLVWINVTSNPTAGGVQNFSHFGSAERRPALAHAVMASLISSERRAPGRRFARPPPSGPPIGTQSRAARRRPGPSTARGDPHACRSRPPLVSLSDRCPLQDPQSSMRASHRRSSHGQPHLVNSRRIIRTPGPAAAR